MRFFGAQAPLALGCVVVRENGASYQVVRIDVQFRILATRLASLPAAVDGLRAVAVADGAYSVTDFLYWLLSFLCAVFIELWSIFLFRSRYQGG